MTESSILSLVSVLPRLSTCTINSGWFTAEGIVALRRKAVLCLQDKTNAFLRKISPPKDTIPFTIAETSTEDGSGGNYS